MSYLKHVLDRIRHEPLAQVLLDGLHRFGITIQPFYLFEEGFFSHEPPAPGEDLRPFEVRVLAAGDMQAVAAVPYRGLSEAFFLDRLERGQGCLGIFAGDELAAFIWYDLEECNYEGWRFALGEHEAYLFDAFTLAPFRGRGVAPFLRYRLYQLLSEAGRTRFYSVSARANAAALRFKQKLGAKILARGLLVELLGRWRFTSSPPGPAR